MTSGGLEGCVVAGKYLVHEKIGQGGMGEIFLAEQLPLNRRVALKLLRPELAASSELVDRLVEEARLLASVEHDSIVRVIDVDRTPDGQPFIVLEYLEGVSLDRLVAEHGFLPWRWAASAVLQVLSAAEVIHRNGLVHLDIKPANCLNVGCAEPLRYAPRTKLIDFGIARVSSRLERAPATGTPAYWAPEQAGANNVDERTDVYSIGATFFELLTGRPPDSRKKRSPSDCNPAAGIPPDLDRIVMQALEQEPSERYPDASSFQERLASVLGEESGTRTLPSLPPRAEATRHAPVELSGPPTDDQLLRLRRKVEAFWVNGVLGASSDAIALANQERTLEHDLIAGLASSLESARPIPVPANRPMHSVYEEYGATLFITGGPGSGKTTQMLLLARDLLKREPRFAPVIFTISTWQQGALSLSDWMVSELYSKYQVPRALGATWIAGGRILPLLDGLDETNASERAACIKAINSFIDASSESLPGLVVTCRFTEYLETREKLAVGMAVRLHDLTTSSVVEYLGRFANHADKQGLLLDEELASLLRTPLILNLVASIDAKAVAAMTHATGQPDRLAQLWDAHITRMVTRSGKRRLPMERAAFLTTLRSLAVAMKRQNQTIFQLDDLQPSVLADARSHAMYFFGSRMVAAAVLGGGIVLSIGLTPLDHMGFRADLAYGAALGLSTAFTGGIVHGGWCLLKRRLALARRAHWFAVIGLGVVTGLANAAMLAGGRHFFAAILAFEIGLFAAPLLSPHRDVGLPHADIRPVEAIRFSSRRAAKAVPYALGIGLVAAALSLPETAPHVVAVRMVYLTALCLLLAGLREKEVETRVLPNGGIQRSIRISTGLAVVGFALTAFGMGVIYGPFYGACAGLTSAAVLWLWYGGLAAIEHTLLRLLLRSTGMAYCDVAFLDAAANRGLLHRVGGGYMFVHPSLMERLVAQSGEASAHEPKKSGVIVTD